MNKADSQLKEVYIEKFTDKAKLMGRNMLGSTVVGYIQNLCEFDGDMTEEAKLFQIHAMSEAFGEVLINDKLPWEMQLSEIEKLA